MNNVKSNKVLILRVIFAIMIIFNCTIIFIYSGQNAEESSNESTGAMYKIIKIISGSENIEKTKELEPLLRKIAHFSIYTSLGIWSGCLMCTFLDNQGESEKDKKMILGTILFGFLYACSDEIHQIFSDGRAGKIIDVMIDTIGVANGVVLVLIILKIIKRKK